MLLSYYPEMKEPKPVAQIEASLGHYAKHWYLRTPLSLKGRGIKFNGSITANEVTSPRLVGWNRYVVTVAAFDKLAKQYDIVSESLL